ncbi:methyl-accepting chemotaxis protein [Deferrisoma palaeochoriense]
MLRAFRRSLSAKIAVSTAATLVVLLGLASAYTAWVQRRTVVDLQTRTNESFATFVYNTLLFSMVEGQMEELQKILENAVSTAGIEALRIVTPDGTVRYSGRPAEIGKKLDDPALERLVQSGSKATGLLELRRAGHVTEAVPLHNQGVCTTCHASDAPYLGAILVGFDFSDFDAQLATIRNRQLGLFAVTVVLVALVVLVSVRSLVLRPIFQLETTARRMAGGDLTQEVSIRGEDEMARLAGHLDTLRTHLRDTLRRSASVATALADAVEKLHDSSESLVSIAMEQSSGAAEQASAVQEATTTAEEIAATSNEISANVESVERVAEETFNACVKGRDAVRDAVAGMREVKEQVGAIAASMMDLGKKSQKIGGIVDIIDEISEQTHLLAVNAAIEAAGAGEHGKRFGVVAGEVRRLAQRTVEATGQIKSLVEEIQNSVNATLLTTEKGTTTARAGAERVDQIGESLETILALVRQTKESAKEITVATQQQATAGEQLVLTITDINDVAVQVNRSAEQVEKAVINLKELARRLKDLAQENLGAQGFTV